MYSKVKSIDKRHNILLGETLLGENPSMNSSFNIQMSFTAVDTTIIYGMLAYQERCRREQWIHDQTLALLGLLFHFASLLEIANFSLPPSASLQARSTTNQEPNTKVVLLLLQGALKP